MPRLITIALLILATPQAFGGIVLRIGTESGGSVQNISQTIPVADTTIAVGVYATITGTSPTDDITLSSFDVPLSMSPSNPSLTDAVIPDPDFPSALTNPNGVVLNSVFGSMTNNLGANTTQAGNGVDLNVTDDVVTSDAVTLVAGTTTKLFDFEVDVKANTMGTFLITFPLAGGFADLLDLRDASNVQLTVDSRVDGSLIFAAVPEPSPAIYFMLACCLLAIIRRSQSQALIDTM